MTSNPIGEKLRRDGFAFVPKLIEPARLAPVIEAFNRAIEDEKLYRTGTNPFFLEHGIEASRSVPDPKSAIPQMAPLLDGATTDIVSSYYGTPFICLLEPYRTYHVPPRLVAQKEAMSNRWHCDERRTDLVKVFILLHTTDESMGPFHTLSLQHTREALRRGYANRNNLGPAAEWMESHAEHLIGEAGDAMFCNTNLCLHRAGIPAAGKTRDMIELRFLPALAGPGADWMDRMDLKAGDE